MRPTDIDPNQYQQQLNNKVEMIENRFADVDMPNLKVFSSSPIHYRMRAEFRVWHEGDDLYHIMFDSKTKQKYTVEHFPPASKLINAVMKDLILLLKSNEVARRKLFQIDYLSTLSGEILVSLLYHKPLDDEWQHAIGQILSRLRLDYTIDLIGRSRKQKITLGRDFVIEKLPVKNQHFIFKQVENGFTQPNAGINSKMIEWALDVTKNSQGDLLELYCGLGNFSIPMAGNFNRVLATEISKSSVAAAQFNIEANESSNVTILRMSSEEFVQAQKGVRTFNRLAGIDLNEYDCRTILVDPPRAGLDVATIEMVKEYPTIVYISCNPETLKDDLSQLLVTHDVKDFALFDQFPYTEHAECGVCLELKR